MLTRPLRLPLIAAVLLAPAGPGLAADAWEIVDDQSRLGFTATQQGGEFEGRFKRFTAEMRFSPDDLANSRFDVTIDVTSVDTGSSQRDRYLPDAEWFHMDQYPQARFETSGFEALGEQRYRAEGTLTIKGNSQPISLPFTWVIEGDTAEMDGQVSLDRTNYQVGSGEWSEGETVGKEVVVDVDLTLTRAGD